MFGNSSQVTSSKNFSITIKFLSRQTEASSGPGSIIIGGCLRNFDISSAKSPYPPPISIISILSQLQFLLIISSIFITLGFHNFSLLASAVSL
jgi:hypothetical protein